MVRAFIALELSKEIKDQLAVSAGDAPRVQSPPYLCGSKTYPHHRKVSRGS